MNLNTFINNMSFIMVCATHQRQQVCSDTQRTMSRFVKFFQFNTLKQYTLKLEKSENKEESINFQ